MASEDSRCSENIQSNLMKPRLNLSNEPFLLIVRTGRIFTDHAFNLLVACDMNEYRRILGVSSK